MAIKNIKRQKRATKTRSKIELAENNRLTVFRSNNHIYVQLIDDNNGVTLASASSLEKSIRDKNLQRKEMAEIIGKNIAKKIIANGIDKVAFDRGKYKYHGLIKILADAARSEGLNF